MSVPVVAFFNNKGGVGKTSLVYHLSWMYAELGTRVVAVDLDSQANLTAMFLAEERIAELLEREPPATIFGSIQPLLKGIGDIGAPAVEPIDDMLALVPGDLSLSSFEDELATMWLKCLDGDERAFRVISAFWRVVQAAAEKQSAQLALIDLGPNLGSLNRAALVAADYVVIPLSPDLYSLQGLRNLGPRLHRWRREWGERRRQEASLPSQLKLPSGTMRPIGYIVLQHAVRLDRPVHAYDRWIRRIPSIYREHVLQENPSRSSHPSDVTIATDPYVLATLKHYRSLMPLAQEARKPMFALKPADGALGAHQHAVKGAYQDFKALARRILLEIEMLPSS